MQTALSCGSKYFTIYQKLLKGMADEDDYAGEEPYNEYKAAFKAHCMDTVKKLISDHMDMAMIVDQIAKDKSFCQRSERIKGHKFITIRPPPNTPFECFFRAVNEYLTRKWINSFELVFEQKGETEETLGYGFHVHLVVQHKGNKGKSAMIEECQHDFKKYNIQLGGNQPYIVPIQDQKNLEKILNGYMSDWKKNDQLKCAAFSMDEPWRQKVGLLRKYNEAPLPIPRGLLSP